MVQDPDQSYQNLRPGQNYFYLDPQHWQQCSPRYFLSDYPFFGWSRFEEAAPNPPLNTVEAVANKRRTGTGGTKRERLRNTS